jgi:replicative DNA helicase
LKWLIRDIKRNKIKKELLYGLAFLHYYIQVFFTSVNTAQMLKILQKKNLKRVLKVIKKIIANNSQKRQEEKIGKSRLDVCIKNKNNNAPELKISIPNQYKDKNNLLQKENTGKLVLTNENKVFAS